MTGDWASGEAPILLLGIDSYEVRQAGSLTAEEIERLKETCLVIGEGERLHEIVTNDLGGGRVVTVLSRSSMADCFSVSQSRFSRMASPNRLRGLAGPPSARGLV